MIAWTRTARPPEKPFLISCGEGDPLRGYGETIAAGNGRFGGILSGILPVFQDHLRGLSG
jgi:hypothetical protein